MKYLLAIHLDERYWAELDEDAQRAELDAYWAYDAAAERGGVLIAAHALEPTASTTTVRVRDEVIVSDGPFAETKEQLGGFYLLECESREEAVEWAARIPGAARGHVEVRPIVEFEEPEGDLEHPDLLSERA